MGRRLGVGFVGSGFITRFHVRSWLAVRDADVRGIWSPNKAHAEETAALARSLRVGEAKAFSSLEEMVTAPEIDAIWICGPNHARSRTWRRSWPRGPPGRELVGIACEKPLARNVAEARRMVELVKKAGVLHGYLEDQLFSPGLERGHAIVWARGAALSGRPYLARAAEEHSGPHMPWFWQGDLQGGGVLNDMMCHSLEVGRFLLTKPGAPRASLKPEEGVRPDRVAQVVAARVREDAPRDRWATRSTTSGGAFGGLRPRHRRPTRRRADRR